MSLSCTCSDTPGPVQSLNGTLSVRNRWPPKALKLTSGRRSDAVVAQVEHKEMSWVGREAYGIMLFALTEGLLLAGIQFRMSLRYW